MTRARALSALTTVKLKHEPRVCHAVATSVGDVTLHHSIPFRTVCQTIRDAAFGHGNHLPVIISLEVHANLQQQEKMVEIMKDEWGDLLLADPLPHCHPDKDQPTLRDLQKKILIKVKTAPMCSAPSAKASCPRDGTLLSPTSETGLYPEKGAAKPAALSKRPMHESLQKLAIYTFSPGHFESFDAEDAQRPGHIYSFGEETIKTLHWREHDGLFAHNQRFLARTYPESLCSFLSSNPNYPTQFWRNGVQMVALNWQVWDTAMEINSAMFDNENGWVLKPPGYRSSNNNHHPHPHHNIGYDDSSRSSTSNDSHNKPDQKEKENAAHRQADDVVVVEGGKKRLDLTITVLAGQLLPTPQALETSTRVDVTAVTSPDFRPRVTCFLHVAGANDDEEEEIVKKTRPARTEHPDWGATGSRLHFPQVRHVVEELSFVRYVF